MSRTGFMWVGSLALLVALAGCGDDGSSANGTDAGTGPDSGMAASAQIRVLHLSPDAPAVDVFANGATPAVVSDLAFGDGTDYLTVPAGTYDFAVAPTGTTPGDAVLNVDGLALAGDTMYTAVAYDEVASISALPLVDDESGLAAGDIRVRAIHAAPAVGEVDIWNVTDPGSPAALYTNVSFGDVGDYLDVPAAAYSLGFDVDNDMVPDLTFDLPALPAGTVANVFAVSQGSDVFLIAQLDDGTVARVDPTP